MLYAACDCSHPLVCKIGLPETARKCAQTAQIDLETSGMGECMGLDGSGKGTEGGAAHYLCFRSIFVDANISEIIARKYCVWQDNWLAEELHSLHQRRESLCTRRNLERVRGEHPLFDTVSLNQSYVARTVILSLTLLGK